MQEIILLVNISTLLIVIGIFFFQQRNEIRREIWEKEREINEINLAHSQRIRNLYYQLKKNNAPYEEINKTLSVEARQLNEEDKKKIQKLEIERKMLLKRGRRFLL